MNGLKKAAEILFRIFLVAGNVIVVGAILMFLIMAYTGEFEGFDSDTFWNSPVSWLLAAVFLTGMVVNLTSNSRMKEDETAYPLRGLNSFFWFSSRIAILVLLFPALSHNGALVLEPYMDGLVFAGVWLGLWGILLWFAYGKVYRGRMEELLKDRLTAWTEAHEGKAYTPKAIKEWIYETELLPHGGKNYSTATYRRGDHLPYLFHLPEDDFYLGVHTLNEEHRQPGQGTIRQTTTWHFLAVLKPAAIPGTFEKGKVYRPSQLADLQKNKSGWGSLVRKYRITGGELNGENLMIVWKPRVSLATLNIRAPRFSDIEELYKQLTRTF